MKNIYLVVVKPMRIALVLAAMLVAIALPAFAQKMKLPDGTIVTCAGVGKDGNGNYVCRNGGDITTLPPGTVPAKPSVNSGTKNPPPIDKNQLKKPVKTGDDDDINDLEVQRKK
ncbi:MAG: hypothetical protein HY036_01195 [Nitrospirae bacterium]|nr:hypothetical protein [Nitrospirota bacterium]MBI3351173.1 hypothetical protein [Nitrospirota bacterium]